MTEGDRTTMERPGVVRPTRGEGADHGVEASAEALVGGADAHDGGNATHDGSLLAHAGRQDERISARLSRGSRGRKWLR
jgi:hypothetical protein